MTVRGIGVDVVDVAAFAAQLDDAASGFAAATFRPAERGPVPGEPEPATPRALRLAGRFAAKEAFVKAWSAARHGRAPALAAVDLREVEVVADAYRRPALRLHGAVAAAVADLEAEAGPLAVHVSISHDGPAAVALVVLDGPG